MIGKIQIHEAPPVRRFAATILRVVDGDTVEVSIDVGFGLSLTDHIRILGINCPEMNTADGLRAKTRALVLLPIGEVFILQAQKSRDKYGRILGDFEIGNQMYSDILLNEGHAIKMLRSGPPEVKAFQHWLTEEDIHAKGR